MKEWNVCNGEIPGSMNMDMLKISETSALKPTYARYHHPETELRRQLAIIITSVNKRQIQIEILREIHVLGTLVHIIATLISYYCPTTNSVKWAP
jgi:hypothetical protein